MRKLIICLTVLGGAAVGGATILALQPVQDAEEMPGNPQAVLHTSAGDITFTLRADAAPKTVARFIENAEKGVYDDIVFHAAFGDTVYTGAYLADGSLKPHRVPLAKFREIDNGLMNVRGRVGIVAYDVRSPRDSHEFYIALGDVPSFDGLTVFAEVTEGLDLLDEIRDSADEEGVPSLSVVISGVSVVAYGVDG